jgi:hypothetical protein
VESHNVPATLTALDAERIKKGMNIDEAAGGVSSYIMCILKVILILCQCISQGRKLEHHGLVLLREMYISLVIR